MDVNVNLLPRLCKAQKVELTLVTQTTLNENIECYDFKCLLNTDHLHETILVVALATEPKIQKKSPLTFKAKFKGRFVGPLLSTTDTANSAQNGFITNSKWPFQPAFYIALKLLIMLQFTNGN